MKKTTFYYGGIGGIVMILCFLVPSLVYDTGIDFFKSEISVYVSVILPLTAIFFGIKNYRNKKLNGIISFGQAFGLGSEISGIASLIFGIYSFFLYKYFVPDLSIK